MDRQIARAAALQATDPRAAARWAQLDRQLTDRAIFLPTVIPNEVNLLSRRAGNYPVQPGLGSAHRPALGPLSLRAAMSG